MQVGVEAWCEQVALKAFMDGVPQNGLIVTYSLIASALGGEPDLANHIMDRAHAAHARMERSKQEAARLAAVRTQGVQFR